MAAALASTLQKERGIRPAARANMQVGDCRGALDYTLGCMLSFVLDAVSFSKVSRTNCVLDALSALSIRSLTDRMS